MTDETKQTQQEFWSRVDNALGDIVRQEHGTRFNVWIVPDGWRANVIIRDLHNGLVTIHHEPTIPIRAMLVGPLAIPATVGAAYASAVVACQSYPAWNDSTNARTPGQEAVWYRRFADVARKLTGELYNDPDLPAPTCGPYYSTIALPIRHDRHMPGEVQFYCNHPEASRTLSEWSEVYEVESGEVDQRGGRKLTVWLAGRLHRNGRIFTEAEHKVSADIVAHELAVALNDLCNAANLIEADADLPDSLFALLDVPLDNQEAR